MNEDQFRSDVRAALAAAVTEVPGLEVRLDLAMPWIMEPGANDGYWVAFGLERWTDVPQELWRTFLFVSYTAEDDVPPREHPLDVKLIGTGARDAVVLAAMALAVVRADLAKRRAASSGKPVSLLPGCEAYRLAARQWAGFGLEAER